MSSHYSQFPHFPPRFDLASDAILTYLRNEIPLGFWGVTRFDGERQVYLTVNNVAFPVTSGDSVAWADSMCQYMVLGETPNIAPDVREVPQYSAIEEASALSVGTYVGLPLVTSDGTLFGTLCGFDEKPHEDSLEAHHSLLELLVSLLANVLEADLDRTAVQRALEQAELRASTDTLTGLLNRGGWEHLLEHEEARYRRFGDPGAVISVDLDHLKPINDTKGHHAGDEYLRTAARALADNVRSADIVARVGGDEFGILAPKTTADDAEELTRRLSQALHAVGVTASFGHAQYTISDGFAGAWKAADTAMYQQKKTRREPFPSRNPRQPT
ncbi:GGDEF domain-containing protein [Antrihabitans sp. NCIMB 15449]|uniref:GGDEF domain-containing protein n=1 Tax=Antrihabitans spumae TaxID=3373370 RepID=A0ABW7JV38_9NOCA